MIPESLRRIWFLLNRRRLERTLDDEMEFHREMMEREGRIGFGSTLRLREQAREAWGWMWLDHLRRDLKYGIRALRNSPGYTLATIAVLSIGIGGNTAMFSSLHAVLLEPLPFRDPARLVLGRCTIDGELNPMVSAPDYYDYREQSDRFDGFSAVFPMELKTSVTGGGQPIHASMTFVEHDFFRTLGVAPSAGRWFSPEESRAGGPRVAVISGGFAQRRFGSAANAVGASLAMDGNALTVVGVMPAGFRLFHDYDVWLPARRGEGMAAIPRQFNNWLIVARLKDGVSLESAQRQLEVISKRLARQYPDSNAHKALRIDPLQNAITGPQAPRLLALMGAVALLLLIACANVAGLALARASVRRPEFAMRAALGASRARIAAQLLVESGALALFSGALGIMLAAFLSRLLPQLIALDPADAPARGLSWPVLLFALALSILTGLLFGAAPALRASTLAGGLASTNRTIGRRDSAYFRAALVAGQVAVSLVLLVGAGLLIRSFVHLSKTNVGFEAQRLLTGQIQLANARYPRPEQRARFFENLRDDLAGIPGVKAVGFSSHLPILDPGFNLAAWNPDHAPADPAARPMAFRRVVLPGYFQALRIPLLAGRDFSAADRENAPLTMVISDRMARTLFPAVNPLGRRVAVDLFNKTTLFEVVGIVGDARLEFAGEDLSNTMYLSYGQFSDWTMSVALRTDQNQGSVTRDVRRLLAARDPEIALDSLVPMERILSESLAPQRSMAALFGILAVMASLLAAIGLYGLLAYSVARRTREIGLRLAVGAQPADVLRLIMRQGFVLAAIGVLIGLAGAAGLTQLLTRLLFGVPPTDPMTFATVSLGLLAVALLATWLPARRAAAIDPTAALRQE